MRALSSSGNASAVARQSVQSRTRETRPAHESYPPGLGEVTMVQREGKRSTWVPCPGCRVPILGACSWLETGGLWGGYLGK